MIVKVISLLLHVQRARALNIPSGNRVAAPHTLEHISLSVCLDVFQHDFPTLTLAAADTLQCACRTTSTP